MLAGSTPVVALIVPSTALGACLLMARRPGWDHSRYNTTTSILPVLVCSLKHAIQVLVF